jgi:hypothetical protein
MGLPPLITVPIEEFFDRAVRRAATGIGSVLSRALRMANVYAHGLMLAPVSDAPVTPLTAAEYRNAFGVGAPPELDPVQLRSEALTAVNLLSGVSGAQATELCRPLVSGKCGRIWYCRHSSYSSFDPLGVLLGFAGDVEVRDALPEASDMPKYSALVVAATRQENPLIAKQEVEQILRIAGGRPVPVLYLSGVAGDVLSVPENVVCRRLPISLVEALGFLDAVGKDTASTRSLAAA